MNDDEKDELETGAESATDTGDSVSDKSEAELEGKAPETDDDETGDGDAGRESGDPVKQVEGLKKRIAKLTAQRNRSRTAETERDVLKARVDAFESREREREDRRRSREAATPEAQKTAERRAAVRETIDDAYGRGTSAYLESRQEEQRLQQESYALNGVSALRSELEDHDIPITDETLVRYERAIGSEIAEDPELLARYRRPGTQAAAIRTAFERVRDGLLNPVLKHRKADTVARLDRNRDAVLGGGKNRGAVADAPEPTFDLTPPKNLKGRALEEWWTDAAKTHWTKLNASA